MKTIIIGAGASGLVAAISAARNNSEVTVIEHEKQIGKKILITGNGRCNITNENLSSSMYYGNDDFIDCVLDQFSTEDIREFFESLGMYTCSKNGYIYPESLQASTVLNFLREAAIDLGVKIKTNNRVSFIRQENNKFFVNIGVELECDKLIIATGGCSFPKTGSDGSGFDIAKRFGHSIVEPNPALTALICSDNILKKASGVRVNGCISAKGKNEMGEIQLTDYGISGIPVFNISRLVDQGDKVEIDFAPYDDENDLMNKMMDLLSKNGNKSIDFALNGLFHEKIASVITYKLGIHNNLCKTIKDYDAKNIVDLIKNYEVTVQKRRGFDFAQVTAGGISTEEIISHTMESKLVKNLYFAGEIIDVDGICGGYNLHFAWATGIIAGRNCK